MRCRIMLASCALFGVALLLATHVESQQPKGKKEKSGEVNTPPAKGERVKDTVKVGDAAPDFTLTDVSGKGKATLSSFKDKKPVVLIFGSYT